MPRETIHTPYPHDPESGPPPFQIQVGWQADCDVQLGVASADSRHLVDYLYADEQDGIGRVVYGDVVVRLIETGVLEEAKVTRPLDLSDEVAKAIGRDVLDAITASTPYGGSVWATLSRASINQLVRLLRKARDSAYGADA